MVLLKEQAELFVGQVVLAAEGTARGIAPELFSEQVLTGIRTFGKEIFFCFPDFTLRIHLMFFGKYAIDGTVNRVLELGLIFESGRINFYACDCRLVRLPLDELYDWSADVMQSTFNAGQALKKLYSKPERLICEALLDQTVLAGVGNGIKNEVLFRRRIHPESRVGEIPEPRLKKLVKECVTLSFEYLQWQREGNADSYWQVYRQKICPRDHIPVRKENLGKSGRPCYFCDKCQQLYLPDADL